MNKEKIAKELMAMARELTAGPKDVIHTTNIQVKIIDWTEDKDEPAYDVNVIVGGKSVTGGIGVFSVVREGGEGAALRKARRFATKLVSAIVKASGGKL